MWRVPKSIWSAHFWHILVTLSLLFLGVADGQARPPKKDGPKVLMSVPLGVPPGATTTVTLRGLKLDTATTIRFQDLKATAKILSKGKSAVPDKIPADKAGDTQLVVEVTLRGGMSSGTLPLFVITPSGETSGSLLINDGPVIAEKEPNDGFRQAQPLPVPATVEGAISRPQDVDVFRIEGQAGQRLVIEVLAARHGSLLDSFLYLYDADGQEIAANDDHGGSTDSWLEVTLPKQGAYYISLLDAHDSGSAAHVYRLLVRPAK